MATGSFGRVWLDRQADQIERAMSNLELPVRVNGGQVREGRVRYHLTPIGTTRWEAVAGSERQVAAALGAAEVRVARETGGLSLEIPADLEPDLELLPLMHALGDLPPRTAVIGMTEGGHPLTLSLDEPGTQHLLVQAPAGSGKSELLRSLLLSLSLTSRPAQLQLMAIDLDGRELACLEALPHALTDLASDAPFAVELARWLAAESERRAVHGVDEPALLLALDGYERIPASARRAIGLALKRCLAAGPEACVHLLAAGRSGALEGLGGGRSDVGTVHARDEGQVGQFRFRTAHDQVVANTAWLPARSLQKAVRLARGRPQIFQRDRLRAALP